MTNNDLISRSALKAELMKRAVSCPKSHIRAYGSCISALEVSPAIDAEPVRHGQWSDYKINGYDGLHPVYETQCSLCGKYTRFTYRYCPHCGARMDGGNEDG